MAEMLSEHFSVAEFEHSDTAIANKIDNKMTEAHKAAVKHFCIYVLEKIRSLLTEKYGKVIIKITSGYRSSSLNKVIKGSNTSQHSCPNGSAAADIWVYKYVGDKKVQILPSEVYENIKAWMKDGKVVFDQLIEEKVSGKEWCHVSCVSQLSACRKQCLKYNGKKYSLDTN